MIIVHAAVIAAYAVFFCRYKPQARIILGTVFYSTELCVTAFSGNIPTLLWNVPNANIVEIAVRNMFVATTLLVPIFLLRFNMDKLPVIDNGNLLLVLAYNLFSVVSVVLGNVFKWDFAYEGTLFTSVAYIGFVAVDLIAYYVVYRMGKSNNLNLELLADKYMNERSIEAMKLNRKSLDELHKIRHDIKNHCANMRLMLRQKQYDALEKYFSEFENAAYEPLSLVDCGNENISAIVNLEISKARSAGLDMETKLFVPASLPFPDSEICSLITNVVDNAVEGSKRTGATDKIELGITVGRDDYLYITVTNGVAGASREELLSRRTSKDNPLLHGYGTRIVNGIVERYGGQINRDVINGKFIVDIMLDMLWNKKTEE